MSVNAIDSPGSADLISAISQGVGQGAVPVDAAVGVLKKAIDVAQSGEQQLIAEESDIGKNLNVYA
jgi:hypothetical protein